MEKAGLYPGFFCTLMQFICFKKKHIYNDLGLFVLCGFNHILTNSIEK